MPYIAIKGFPKDDKTIREVAERINETLLELWGCRQEHINISYEAVPPEEWDERIERGEVAQNMDKMLFFGGKKMYEEKKTHNSPFGQLSLLPQGALCARRTASGKFRLPRRHGRVD